MKKKKFGYYLIVLVLGAVVGSVLGDALGTILPAGVVKQFFLKSQSFGISPAELNLKVIQFTFGFKIHINVIGVVGVFLVAYFLRWME